MDDLTFKKELEEKVHNVNKEVLKFLNEESMSVISGGYLRDLRLNRKPEDVDIITTLTPDELEAIFSNLSYTETGREFGVTRANFRGFNYEFFSAHPDEFISKVSNKDFTINSLFYDGKEVIGEPHYFLDIDYRILRSNEIFSEHIKKTPQAIVRAFRFVAELGFYPTESLLKDINKNKYAFDEVSDSRIVEEGYRVIKGDYNFQAIRAMIKSGIITTSRNFDHLYDKTTAPVNNSLQHRLALLQYYFGEDVIKQFLNIFRISEDFLNQSTYLQKFFHTSEVNRKSKDFSTIMILKRFLYDDDKEKVLEFFNKQT